MESEANVIPKIMKKTFLAGSRRKYFAHNTANIVDRQMADSRRFESPPALHYLIHLISGGC